MRILIVGSRNSGKLSPFVTEQMEAICKAGCEVDSFGIIGSGMLGYLKNLPALKRKIKAFKPDIIHAHYGLSGLLSVLQRKVPTIITFHGSDIHWAGKLVRALSRLAMKGAVHCIFVSEQLHQLSGYKGENYSIIPCGINMDFFMPLNKLQCRKELGWAEDGKYIIFAGAFSNVTKNYALAKEAVELLPGVVMIEMKGWTREQVVKVMNAGDCLLMTSFHEGSPMVVKEAMSCNRPVVSVDVADVANLIGDTQGCYIAAMNKEDVSAKILKALKHQGPTTGRGRMAKLGMNNDHIAKELISIYNKVLNTKKE